MIEIPAQILAFVAIGMLGLAALGFLAVAVLGCVLLITTIWPKQW